jgi:hypothetical protein
MFSTTTSSPRLEIAYLRALIGAIGSAALAVVALFFVPSLHTWIPLLLANAGLMYVLSARLRGGSAQAWSALVGVTAWKAAGWIVLGISDMTAPGEIFPLASALYLPMGLNKLVELGIYLTALTSVRRSERPTGKKHIPKATPDAAK